MIGKLIGKFLDERLSYRRFMDVVEYKILGDCDMFPVCPKCLCTLDREYQSFCDRCGQKLRWKKYYKVYGDIDG